MNTKTQQDEVTPLVQELEDGSATVLFEDVEGQAAPDGEGEVEVGGTAAEQDELGEDERLSSTAGAHDEAAELAAAANDAEREAIRQRRREERAQKKRDVRERFARQEAVIAEMGEQLQRQAEQLAVLTRKSSGTELAQLDNAIQRADQAIASYEAAISEAVATQNGAVAADATRKMLEAQTAKAHLQNIRRAHGERTTEDSTAAPAPQRVDPGVQRNTAAWMSRNTWYNPRSGTPEAQIVRALDAAVAQKFDPKTTEYWEELDRRIAKVLPERGNRSILPDDDASTTTRRPARASVAGGGKSSAAVNGGSKKTFTLSADRVKALKDAGMWDDLTSRNDAIKRFREYDLQQASAAKR